MGLIKLFLEYILEYSGAAYSYVGQTLLSAMSVYAILILRNHGTDPAVALAALFGWFWFIWHNWE